MVFNRLYLPTAPHLHLLCVATVFGKICFYPAVAVANMCSLDEANGGGIVILQGDHNIAQFMYQCLRDLRAHQIADGVPCAGSLKIGLPPKGSEHAVTDEAGNQLVQAVVQLDIASCMKAVVEGDCFTQ